MNSKQVQFDSDVETNKPDILLKTLMNKVLSLEKE